MRFCRKRFDQDERTANRMIQLNMPNIITIALCGMLGYGVRSPK
jgi:hypothetical protein